MSKMSVLRPLKLKPDVWGEEKLFAKYGKNANITPIAKSWEPSYNKDGPNIIDGREYSLSEKATILLPTNQPKYYVGIDLGGTNIAAAVVDEYGTIYGRSTKKTNAPRAYEEIFTDMAACAREAAKESGLSFFGGNRLSGFNRI